MILNYFVEMVIKPGLLLIGLITSDYARPGTNILPIAK